MQENKQELQREQRQELRRQHVHSDQADPQDKQESCRQHTTPPPRVVVVDFGAQYGQLIARRVRDLNVYSEVVPFDIDTNILASNPPAALILSGGPASVYAADAPKLNPKLLELGVPVLGFCYGMQAMAQALGGSVPQTDVGEYGPATLVRAQDEGAASALLGSTPDKQTVWMSHRDSVSAVPEGFVVTASTSTTPVAAMECVPRRLFATQFHPEVHHTTYGNQMLRHFLFDVAGLKPGWTTSSIIERITGEVRAQVGTERVILGLSGGVDSSVVAALLAHAIGRQLTCVFVDTGLLRRDEPEEVETVFSQQFDVDFIHVRAADRFIQALSNVSDPEQKRRIIGSEFWRVFFEEAAIIEQRNGAPVRYLAQGTIYPDVIESGVSRGGAVAAADGSVATGSKQAATIKSHHNLIPFPQGVHFDLLEPLRNLFKDEVRALGTALGLPDHIVHRQPFPGPGLAVRIIGDVTHEKLELLRNADAIVREEIDAYNEALFAQTGMRNSERTGADVAASRGVGGDTAAAGSDGGAAATAAVPDGGERAVWQYFAVLPDIRSVGVMGDERTYAHPIILRAVESRDAMTADWARLPYDLLARISSRIVAEVEGVNRVVYDITSKPPGTIEWE